MVEKYTMNFFSIPAPCDTIKKGRVSIRRASGFDTRPIFILIGTDLPPHNISLPFKGRDGVIPVRKGPHPPPDLPLEGGGT